MNNKTPNEKKVANDRRAAIPLYYQIKEHIKLGIQNGQYQPGQRLPTEEALCKRYKVSRITVRRALAELSQEGLLSSMQGSGTYVNDYSYLRVVTLKAMVTEASWVAPLQQAVELYNGMHPGHHLKLDVAVVGRPQLRFKLVAAVAQGEAPDLALIDWVWMPEFAKRRYLQPLDEIDPAWVHALQADLYPVFVERNTYGNHFYGVQTEANVAVLWYRADLLRQEGIEPPRTWKELVACALHFKQQVVRETYSLGNYPLVFPAGLKAGETTTYQFLAFVWAANGELMQQGKVVLGQPVIDALEFLKSLVHTHHVTPPDVVTYTWVDAPKRFAQGKAVFSVSGSYDKALIQEIAGWDEYAFKDKVGFVPIPAAEQGQQATTAGGMVYALFRQSKHLQQALELLKAVASPDVMLEFSLRSGRKPTRISVAQALHPERDWFLHHTSKLLDIAKIRPSIPEYAQISVQLRALLETVMTCDLSPDQAVQNAQLIIDALTRYPGEDTLQG